VRRHRSGVPLAFTMPIHSPDFRDLTQGVFDEIDHKVMRSAFDSQNELGSLCEEAVYENDLALRLRAQGLHVETQEPVVVSSSTFSKRYRLDLVCEQALYEIKTVSEIAQKHRAQSLNYAMLVNVRHVKLLNFRNDRVEGELCFNALTPEERHNFSVDESKWRALTPACSTLKDRLLELLSDWGAFLDSRLYAEALEHTFGSNADCKCRVKLMREGIVLGTHRVRMHSPDHIFVVTALKRDTSAYLNHLQRLVKHSGMAGAQWINLKRSEIQFRTLTIE
jgi:GxxExxY protein